MRGLTELSIFKSDTTKKAVVLLSGSGSNFQAILDSITADEIALEICAVISNVPGARGIKPIPPRLAIKSYGFFKFGNSLINNDFNNFSNQKNPIHFLYS